MKAVAVFAGIWVLMLGVLFGAIVCHPAQQASLPPSVVVVSLDESIVPFETAWRTEVSRRFSRAVVVAVHGNDFVQGQWIAKDSWNHVTPVADIARKYQALFPTYTVVILSCNPDHCKLGVPGVYYALGNVWLTPDRASDEAKERSAAEPDVVGNIYEFVKDD